MGYLKLDEPLHHVGHGARDSADPPGLERLVHMGLCDYLEAMHEYHREAEPGGRLEAEHVYENRESCPCYFCVTLCVCESEGAEMSVCVV